MTSWLRASFHFQYRGPLSLLCAFLHATLEIRGALPKKVKAVQACKGGFYVFYRVVRGIPHSSRRPFQASRRAARALLKTARGEEAFSLQRRIETMRAELTELRAVRAYLLHDYEPDERGSRHV